MTQNIYDNPAFFAGYSQLGRSLHGLDGAAEWPVVRSLLPNLNGARVLDLGCGFGWFCRWARSQGAIEVLGVDVSANMLARARAETGDPDIQYLQADLETVSLPSMEFDLAYSSLALHYIQDLRGLLSRVQGALCARGRLVFSVEHPIYTAPRRPGWSESPEGQKGWLLDSYMIEGQRVTDWLAPGVIKQHRMVATYINMLIDLGFSLRRIIEWGPSEEQIAARPEWAEYRHRPMFLLVSASR